MRHRAVLKDLSLVLLAVLVTACFLFEADVFVSDGTIVGHSIEPDELPILGAVLNFALLLFAWRRLSEQKRETRRRLAAEEQIREVAFQDPLTGLPNRRRLTDELKVIVASPPRSGGAHALMMIDLNGFKQVNDVYGHGAGDRALIVIGQRMLQAVRPGDLVTRLGGDEFAVISHHLSGAEGATGVALRIIEALAAPVSIGTIQRHIGAGIGICLLPFEGDSPEEAMRRADVALYRAKAELTSSMRFFDTSMDHHIRERELMERELRDAVAKQQIHPHFQPLVDLATKRIVGFEALARWTHEDLGPIPPERFIPIAEDTGLIHELGLQLLRAACTAASGWPDHVILAFNISAVQLRDRTLGLRILSVLNETRLLPSRLEIEITESALVQDLEAAQEALGALRQIGVRIALDDFGTGYSNLYHLRSFKLDKIKIDRSFVQCMASEKESAEIVSALLGLGHGLGLTVTAEGIEEGGAESELLAKGCQQGQGYLFGRAVSAGEALALVAEGDATPAGLAAASAR